MNKESWFVAATVAVTHSEFCRAVDIYLQHLKQDRALREVDAVLEASIKLRLGRI
jgi:hypothetical protein